MSVKNRKYMFDKLIKADRKKDIVKRLWDEFGGKVVKPKKEEPKETPEDKKVLTEKELFALNKAEQVEILNKLGVKEIPGYEQDRVNKILELQVA